MPVSASVASRYFRNGEKTILEVEELSVRYDLSVFGVRGISTQILGDQVTALVGPSGCGKTTFLRALNRMHDLRSNTEVTGSVYLHGENIYAPQMDPVLVRRRIGMVFQKPNPFPTKSILENVCAGQRMFGARKKSMLKEVAEQALHAASLWEEVKDRLDEPGGSLSGGQQQRLCIARALAVKPDLLLMDEPTSSLDPHSTERVEQLIRELRTSVAIVFVTHDIHQAARVSDHAKFFLEEY